MTSDDDKHETQAHGHPIPLPIPTGCEGDRETLEGDTSLVSTPICMSHHTDALTPPKQNSTTILTTTHCCKALIASWVIDSTQCGCRKHCLSSDWKRASWVTMEDTLWSWVSSWKTKTQNPTYTPSNKTDVLEMVVRHKGGVYSFSFWHVSTGLYIPDKYNLCYK